MSERKLVGTQEMFAKALAGGYAIGAYNVNNMEILQGIAEAAEETRSPIILQVSAGARKYANQTYLIKLVEAALATTTVPIALHLDHGADFEICKACIDGGFTSVMIDASSKPFEENIEITKKVNFRIWKLCNNGFHDRKNRPGLLFVGNTSHPDYALIIPFGRNGIL